MTPEDAIYRACVLRFRPILMTTMAALLGAVPLMLGTIASTADAATTRSPAAMAQTPSPAGPAMTRSRIGEMTTPKSI